MFTRENTKSHLEWCENIYTPGSLAPTCNNSQEPDKCYKSLSSPDLEVVKHSPANRWILNYIVLKQLDSTRSVVIWNEFYSFIVLTVRSQFVSKINSAFKKSFILKNIIYLYSYIVPIMSNCTASLESSFRNMWFDYRVYVETLTPPERNASSCL